MDIKAKKFEMKISYSELWATTFDVQNALEHALKTHWINHQEQWKENEKERLSRLRYMFYALGRPDLYEQIFLKSDEIFQKINKK